MLNQLLKISLNKTYFILINKITDFDSFNSLDIRVGTILKANEFIDLMKISEKMFLTTGDLVVFFKSFLN